jgi:hypothetical protein
MTFGHHRNEYENELDWIYKNGKGISEKELWVFTRSSLMLISKYKFSIVENYEHPKVMHHHDQSLAKYNHNPMKMKIEYLRNHIQNFLSIKIIVILRQRLCTRGTRVN